MNTQQSSTVKTKGENNMTTKPTHTPGPWMVDERIIYCEEQQIAAVLDSALPEDVIEANARLIAACPTMFDYIQSKAKEGDENAKEILRNLQA